jgi:hypothetical protein
MTRQYSARTSRVSSQIEVWMGFLGRVAQVCLIVAKVGIRATREELFLSSESIPNYFPRFWPKNRMSSHETT